MSPELQVYQRQRKQKVDLRWLRRQAMAAVPLCLAECKADDAPLALLHELEVSIISDKQIAQVHADFMGDPTATDVITFHHGEILISADTAALRGPEHGHELGEELLLYLVHGLLHLAGWEDHDPEERAEMHRLQDGILAKLLG